MPLSLSDLNIDDVRLNSSFTPARAILAIESVARGVLHVNTAPIEGDKNFTWNGSTGGTAIGPYTSATWVMTAGMNTSDNSFSIYQASSTPAAHWPVVIDEAAPTRPSSYADIDADLILKIFDEDETTVITSRRVTLANGTSVTFTFPRSTTNDAVFTKLTSTRAETAGSRFGFVLGHFYDATPFRAGNIALYSDQVTIGRQAPQKFFYAVHNSPVSDRVVLGVAPGEGASQSAPVQGPMFSITQTLTGYDDFEYTLGAPSIQNNHIIRWNGSNPRDNMGSVFGVTRYFDRLHLESLHSHGLNVSSNSFSLVDHATDNILNDIQSIPPLWWEIAYPAITVQYEVDGTVYKYKIQGPNNPDAYIRDAATRTGDTSVNTNLYDWYSDVRAADRAFFENLPPASDTTSRATFKMILHGNNRVIRAIESTYEDQVNVRKSGPQKPFYVSESTATDQVTISDDVNKGFYASETTGSDTFRIAKDPKPFRASESTSEDQVQIVKAPAYPFYAHEDLSDDHLAVIKEGIYHRLYASEDSHTDQVRIEKDLPKAFYAMEDLSVDHLTVIRQGKYHRLYASEDSHTTFATFEKGGATPFYVTEDTHTHHVTLAKGEGTGFYVTEELYSDQVTFLVADNHPFYAVESTHSAAATFYLQLDPPENLEVHYMNRRAYLLKWDAQEGAPGYIPRLSEHTSTNGQLTTSTKTFEETPNTFFLFRGLDLSAEDNVGTGERDQAYLLEVRTAGVGASEDSWASIPAREISEEMMQTLLLNHVQRLVFGHGSRPDADKSAGLSDIEVYKHIDDAIVFVANDVPGRYLEPLANHIELEDEEEGLDIEEAGYSVAVVVGGYYGRFPARKGDHLISEHYNIESKPHYYRNPSDGKWYIAPKGGTLVVLQTDWEDLARSNVKSFADLVCSYAAYLCLLTKIAGVADEADFDLHNIAALPTVPAAPSFPTVSITEAAVVKETFESLGVTLPDYSFSESISAFSHTTPLPTYTFSETDPDFVFSVASPSFTFTTTPPTAVTGDISSTDTLAAGTTTTINTPADASILPTDFDTELDLATTGTVPPSLSARLADDDSELARAMVERFGVLLRQAELQLRNTGTVTEKVQRSIGIAELALREEGTVPDRFRAMTERLGLDVRLEELKHGTALATWQAQLQSTIQKTQQDLAIYRARLEAAMTETNAEVQVFKAKLEDAQSDLQSNIARYRSSLDHSQAAFSSSVQNYNAKLGATGQQFSSNLEKYNTRLQESIQKLRIYQDAVNQAESRKQQSRVQTAQLNLQRVIAEYRNSLERHGQELSQYRATVDTAMSHARQALVTAEFKQKQDYNNVRRCLRLYKHRKEAYIRYAVRWTVPQSRVLHTRSPGF